MKLPAPFAAVFQVSQAGSLMPSSQALMPSRVASRLSRSHASMDLRLASSTPAMVLASSGVMSARAITAVTSPCAAVRSAAISTLGKSIWIGRDLRGGQTRSRHSFRACISSARASSTAFWAKASAWLSNSASPANVALLRAPLGRRALPYLKGVPRVLPALFRVELAMGTLLEF